MERLVEDISFDAPDKHGQTVHIDKTYVDERIGTLAADTDLSKFVL
jgi:ATP-dependent HslUV protease ATP-binding subunit HslU